MKDDPRTKVIKGIVGVEPNREGEYPTSAFVVDRPDAPDYAITAIERREEDYGDHGIAWFDVYAGDRLLTSIAARYVAEIHYGAEAAA